MDIKKTLFEIVRLTQLGHIAEVSEYITEYFKGKADVQKLDANSVAVTFKGKGDYTLMVDAHIDQVGMVVTDVDDDGFVKVQSVGSLDFRTLPAKAVKILSDPPTKAVFCSVPPHLKLKDFDFSDIKNLTLDTGLKNEAKKIIKVGDYACYDTAPSELLGDKITAPFLDNRAGVACLLLLADNLKNNQLPISVTLLFSTEEELGLRRAKTSAFAVSPDEAIAVDVTFGTCPSVSSAEGGELSKGAMVGISPFLSREVTNRIISVAEENKIDIQKEVMSGATSTNADAIGIVKDGIKCGLLSVPIRNMHTSCEVADIKDIKSTAKLLYAYIMAGGCCEC